MLKRSVSNLASYIIDAIFPARCVFCDAFHVGPYCDDCRVAINWDMANFFSASPGENSFGRCFSVTAFDGVARKAIHAFKFEGRTDKARAFARLMADKVRSKANEFDIITAVPPNRVSFRTRGFANAALLAKFVAKEVGIHFAPRILTTAGTLTSQHTLTKSERFKMAARAYKLRDGHPSIQDKRILLIDDIITTGATLDACAKRLLHGGASKVDVLTLGRTL